jgi:UDP-N-acetylmuramoylalanine--D-glutamate ligase
MQELRGKRALVMGLGVNAGGLGVTRFLVEQGAEVTVTDLRGEQVLAPSLRELEGLPLRLVLGRHEDADFQNAELVIRNPGVPRESRYLALAREHGAQIEMEMTLFFRLCRGPILGITGTRGKTTTTLLTGAIMREQFPDAVVAGNMRISALEQLPKIGPRTPVVLELSSWQLEGLGEAGLSPQYACVTNLSPDHLDRYRDMQEYGAAKQQIFLHQRADRGDVVVLNADDPIVCTWVGQTAVEPAWFSTREPRTERHPNIAWWQGERLMWNDLPICTARDLRLAGEHNRANVAAAVALARSYRPPVESERIVAAIRGFEGVADRMELVREHGGVRFVNDTTATTPTATAAALRALDTPVILIAGGADKHLDFEDLAVLIAERSRPEVAGRIKALLLLDGTATPRLAGVLANAGVTPAGTYAALAPAVEAARALASPGDTVLLSPACASFGMFVNEFDRGAQFRRIVEALP